jgi:hypothetical protein
MKLAGRFHRRPNRAEPEQPVDPRQEVVNLEKEM